MSNIIDSIQYYYTKRKTLAATIPQKPFIALPTATANIQYLNKLVFNNYKLLHTN